MENDIVLYACLGAIIGVLWSLDSVIRDIFLQFKELNSNLNKIYNAISRIADKEDR